MSEFKSLLSKKIDDYLEEPVGGVRCGDAEALPSSESEKVENVLQSDSEVVQKVVLSDSEQVQAASESRIVQNVE